MATVRFSPAVPELRMFELPFVVRDRAATMNALDGALGDRIKQSMHERTRFRALGFWDNGFRHFTNKVRPIRTPADCKGLRIRLQLSDLLAESMSALGFVPVPTDIKEFLERIGTDRFDAQENPLTNTYNFGMHKHHRYITMSGHFFGASVLVCSQAQYASWPQDVQQAVETAAHEATALQHKLAAEEDDEILAKIDPKQNEIIRLTPAEREAFVNAVEPVLERHRKDIDPELLAYLR
jgi:tripartite ATP-independent transporter DctP family solute receptor